MSFLISVLFVSLMAGMAFKVLYFFNIPKAIEDLF